MIPNITWKSFETHEIPSILEHGYSNNSDTQENSDSKYQVKVGLETQEGNPEVILLSVPEENQPDFFSWISTFSPDFFPLSQFKRVIGTKELDLVEKFQKKNIRAKIDSRWASIILGEMLAQGEIEQNTASIPLSRYLACFSTSLARSNAIYDSHTANRICIERLASLHLDRRFVTRTVTFQDLVSCLSFYENNKSENLSIEFLANSFIQKLSSSSATNADFYSNTAKAHFSGLLNESIEKRVISFNSISKAISAFKPDDQSLTGALIAAAAFLVGRGTSHISLLRRTAKEYPGAFVWFGVLSALTDFKNQDPQWKRTTKSIERFIAQNFDINEPVVSDICWAEYLWINNYAGESAFSEIPKLYPRTLSIELLPGVSCQLRLASSVSPKAVEASPSFDNTEKLKNIEQGIDNLIGLAIKLKQSMLAGPYISEPHQTSLLPEPTSEARTKQPRSTRSRSTSKAKKT